MPLSSFARSRSSMVHLIFGLVLLALTIPALAGDFDLDLVQIQELSPPPGTVIGSEGLDQYRQVLDPDLADLIAQGWYTITVGEPLSFDPHPNFVAATQQYGDQTALGSKPIM